MNLNKPKFWEKNNSIYSLMLLPLTFLYLVLIFVKKKITKKNYFNIPIICVGNIYIGGTGKTPLSIYLEKEIQKLGKKSVIIKKFYKNHADEHLLIKEKLSSLILDKDRIRAIKKAEKEFDIAIMDDGFQDYKIKKDLNILCFHGRQLIGNGYTFPSGPLRENLSSIKRAHIVIINGEKNVVFENKCQEINNNIKIFYSKYHLIDSEKYKNKKILAIAGIGNPDNFFNLLLENKLNVAKKLPFPDHYEFSREELQTIIRDANNSGHTILMTEKDFLRIKKYDFKEINYCSIDLKFLEKDRLIKQIKKLYD